MQIAYPSDVIVPPLKHVILVGGLCSHWQNGSITARIPTKDVVFVYMAAGSLLLLRKLVQDDSQ